MSHILAAAWVILGTGLAQILLKIGARDKKRWQDSFLNVNTLSGYGLFLLVTISNLWALQEIPLKHMTAWLGLSYVWVLILSALILKEKLTRNRILGCLFIVLGLVIFASP